MSVGGGDADLRSFERTYEELEEIVRRLEGGALTLDDALAHYERGVGALKRCYKILEVAEKRLELLVRDGDGAISTRPIDLAEVRGESRGSARIAAVQPPAPREAAPAAATTIVPHPVPHPAPAPVHAPAHAPAAPALAALPPIPPPPPPPAQKPKAAPVASGPQQQGGSLF